MLKNYFLVAIRNLLRHKMHSVINVLGLAVGMACCLLISLYILDELRYDRFHEKGDRIYRVLRENVGGEINPRNDLRTSGALAPTVISEFGEVEEAVRIMGLTAKVWVNYEGRVFDQIFKTVDPEFLDVFSFPLIYGDRTTALREPYTVVITASVARQYFGEENPIGKVVRCDENYFQGNYRVTGVMADMSSNSSIKLDMITSTVSPRFRRIWRSWRGPASWRPIQTYVVLKEGASVSALEEKMTGLLERFLKPNDVGTLAYHLQPLHQIHLYSNVNYGIAQDIWMGVYGDINRVYIFGAVAVLVLLIACTNYTNLTTAQSMGRAKEVGVRQVAGAYRAQLLWQFLSESILLAFVALLVAVGLAECGLPALNAFTGKQISFLSEFVFLVPFLIVGTLLVGLLSGVYPAFFLSAFRPVVVLKGGGGPKSKGAWLQKGLVVFQFAITIVLIVGTVVVDRQLNFIQNKRLGYDPEFLVTMPIFGRDREIQKDGAKRLAIRYQTVKDAMLKHPNVLKATAFRWDMGPEGGGGLNIVYMKGQEFQMRIQEADEDFLDTYGMDLVAGRYLTSGGTREETDEFVLNETAVKVLGLEAPLGQTLTWDGEKRRVIGVVKDYHDRSLKEAVAPTAIVFRTPSLWSLAVRINGERVEETLAFLEQQWQHFLPSRPFTFSFVDENLDQMYRAEMKLAGLASLFSVLAILVACLGLFGLVSFTAEQRTKEVGIRKVMGASDTGLVLMLSGVFTRLVLVANVIAWPVAYWVMDKWLGDFVYRIELGVWPFVLSGMLAFLIALATVSLQAWKTARMNPVDALRYE